MTAKSTPTKKNPPTPNLQSSNDLSEVRLSS
jgi:hypothetical protein